MGIRTGAQVLDGLRDGRQLYMDGTLVKDVTKDPRLSGGARTMAQLYDMQNQPELRDEMTYESPKTGARVDVPAKKIPYFKPSKELKDVVNVGGKPASEPAAPTAPAV